LNAEETTQVMQLFALIQPSYRDWKNKQARGMAVEYKNDPAAAWRAMKDSSVRTLSTVTLEEAKAVIGRMESGNLPIPPYGELALTILREAKVGRQSANRFHVSEPTFRCLDCRDSGTVNVWNPSFVEAYRNEFAKVTRTEYDRSQKFKPKQFDPNRFDPEGLITAWVYDPPNWEYLASKWWRAKHDGKGGPIHHAALCHCDGHRTNVLRQELASWCAGTRKNKHGERASLPACGAAKYNAEKMPKKTSCPFDDLTSWYATHQVNEVYAWQP